jgi:ABC-type Na+ efflux pump permease subunit
MIAYEPNIKQMYGFKTPGEVIRGVAGKAKRAAVRTVVAGAKTYKFLSDTHKFVSDINSRASRAEEAQNQPSSPQQRAPRVEEYRAAAQKYFNLAEDAIKQKDLATAKAVYTQAGVNFTKAGAGDIGMTFFKYSGASQEKLEQIRRQISEQPGNQDKQKLENPEKVKNPRLRLKDESGLERTLQRTAAVFMTVSFMLFLLFASTAITGNIAGNPSTGTQSIATAYFLLASIFLGYGLYKLA